MAFKSQSYFWCKNLDTTITVAMEHLEYGHTAITQGKTREALIKDFD